MMKKRSITTSIFPKLNIPTSLKRKGGQKVDFERKAVIALMLQQRTWTQCEIANMNNVSQSLVSTILRKVAYVRTKKKENHYSSHDETNQNANLFTDG